MPDTERINGRFAVGWRGGPGRPRRQTELKYLQALADEVPIEAWRAIVRRAVEDATAGDHQARAFLAKYLCPDEPLELAKVVAELQETLERLRDGSFGNGRGNGHLGG